MENKNRYFANLDTLRFIAAMLVLLEHTIRPAIDLMGAPEPLHKFMYLISDGGTGVSLFFVLSGFLITYLLLEEIKHHGKILLLNFYIRRCLRIWPLYFAVITFSFLVYPMLKTWLGMNQPRASNIWLHLSFLSNFDVLNIQTHCPGSDALSQNVTWSVSVEEQFYLFWPLLFVFIPRSFRFWSMLAVLGAGLTFRYLHADNPSALYFHTMAVIPDLAIGALSAWLVQNIPQYRNFFSTAKNTTRLMSFIIVIIALLIQDAVQVFDIGKAFGRLPVIISFALLINAQALAPEGCGMQIGRWKFAERWGKYTYGIYLLHPIAMLVADIGLRVSGFNVKTFSFMLISGLISISMTFLISRLSYIFLESPFLRIKNKFSNTSNNKQAETARTE